MRNDFGTLSISNIFVLSTGVCETGYTGTDCNQCETGYYGDGTTCTICGTHKTTPPGGSAAAATDCKLIYFGWYSVTFYLKISKLMSKTMKNF